jgi:hypothetical protein
MKIIHEETGILPGTAITGNRIMRMLFACGQGRAKTVAM